MQCHISECSLFLANFKMEEHAEPAHVGRGVGVDWVAKQTFETEAEMKAYCVENLLSRGRTNYNIGRRFTYLICAHDGCNVKMRLERKLLEEMYALEVGDGSEHQHEDLKRGPERGLSEEEKRITLECYARDCGAPKKVPKASYNIHKS